MALAKNQPQHQARRPVPQIPHTRIWHSNGMLIEEEIILHFESGKGWHPGCDKPPYALLSTRKDDIEAYRALVIKLSQEPRQSLPEARYPVYVLIDGYPQITAHLRQDGREQPVVAAELVVEEPKTEAVKKVISKPVLKSGLNPFARRPVAGGAR